MRDKLKTEWRHFRASPPGQRFLHCYERHQKRNAPWLKPLMFFAGVFSFVIGFVLAFIPGPAILFFAISAALFACEYRPVATAFDKVELWGRRTWAKLRGQRSKETSSHDTSGAVSDTHLQASPGGAVEPAPADEVAPPAGDSRNLDAAVGPASVVVEVAPPPMPSSGAPVDMSKLRIPLNDTREIHAQAVAQANVEKYRANVEPQPAAAEPTTPPVVAEVEEIAPTAAAKRSASQWSVQSVVPPRKSDSRGPEPMFGETLRGKGTPHFSSTKQGTGPDQPRVVAIVPHVSRPPTTPRNGTMRIWAAVTTPTAPSTLQNVKRVIQQSAKNDASVVMLAPPAVISDRSRAAGHR